LHLQVVTDRFAGPQLMPADVGTDCNSLANYCGGSWQGILDRVEYIQVGRRYTCSSTHADGQAVQPRVKAEQAESDGANPQQR